MVLIEALPEHQPSGTSALVSRQLQALGLPEAPVIEAPFANGLSRYFAAHRLPVATTDCKLIVNGEEPLAFLHGSDCNMVRLIAKDMRTGTTTPFEFCNRREAGGAFEKVDLPIVWLKSSWRDLQPVESPPGTTCPDCASVVDVGKNEFVHEPTCPLVAGLRRVINEDREYFKTHPGETTRERPPTMAETLNLLLTTHGSLPEPPTGCHWEPGGVVTVVLIADGVRVRRYGDALAVAAPNKT